MLRWSWGRVEPANTIFRECLGAVWNTPTYISAYHSISIPHSHTCRSDTPLGLLPSIHMKSYRIAASFPNDRIPKHSYICWKFGSYSLSFSRDFTPCSITDSNRCLNSCVTQMSSTSEYKTGLIDLFSNKVGHDMATYVIAPFVPEEDESEERVAELVIEYLLKEGEIESKDEVTVEVDLRDDVIYDVDVHKRNDRFWRQYHVFASYKETEAIRYKQDIWNDMDAFELMKDWAERNNYKWDSSSETYGEYLICLSKRYAEVLDDLVENFPDYFHLFDSYHKTSYVICGM